MTRTPPRRRSLLWEVQQGATPETAALVPPLYLQLASLNGPIFGNDAGACAPWEGCGPPNLPQSTFYSRKVNKFLQFQNVFGEREKYFLVFLQIIFFPSVCVGGGGVQPNSWVGPSQHPVPSSILLDSLLPASTAFLRHRHRCLRSDKEFWSFFPQPYFPHRCLKMCEVFAATSKSFLSGAFPPSFYLHDRYTA